MTIPPKPSDPGASGRKRGKRGGGKRFSRRPAPPTTTREHLPTVEETSAGGLVVDFAARPRCAALIGRLDRRNNLRWSLPKGHLEEGETSEQAAVREVHEETGIMGTILAPIGPVDYWFIADGRRVHKTVHHFLLEAIGGELSDEDVEVTSVAWVPLDQVRGQLAYEGERRVLDTALSLLPAEGEGPDALRKTATPAPALPHHPPQPDPSSWL